MYVLTPENECGQLRPIVKPLTSWGFDRRMILGSGKLDAIHEQH